MKVSLFVPAFYPWQLPQQFQVLLLPPFQVSSHNRQGTLRCQDRHIVLRRWEKALHLLRRGIILLLPNRNQARVLLHKHRRRPRSRPFHR